MTRGAWMAGMLLVAAAAVAQTDKLDADVIRMANGNSFRGRVLHWDDAVLRVEVPPGRMLEYKAADVRAVETVWTAAHELGLSASVDGRWAEAARQFALALQQESRPWVIQRLHALRVRAWEDAGAWPEANAAFLEWAGTKRTDRLAAAAPLAWASATLPASARAEFRKQLDDLRRPYASILAASWLAGDADHAREAAERLRQAAAGSDRMVAVLAEFQLARREAPTPARFAAMQRRLQDVPRQAAAGPLLALDGWRRRLQPASPPLEAVRVLALPTPPPQPWLAAARSRAAEWCRANGYPADAAKLSPIAAAAP